LADTQDTELVDTLKVEGEAKSSSRVLTAIRKATDTFRDYQDTCRRIDDVYSREGADGNWLDPNYDLFWASMEILKPAIYAKPPVPAVAPMFSDRRPLYNVTAELLERVVSTDFDRANIDQTMLSLRDDLAFTNRGVPWVIYESDEKGGGQRACVDHIDRMDFLHEPARSWAEVGWAARRAWMTKTEMRKRFLKTSGETYKAAKTEIRRDDKDNGGADDSKKAGVWEVWHKADNKVYWVADGCDKLLDEGKPHLTLKDFFPCPRPAYGTLRRRSLVPIPDYVRYAAHLNQINTLTGRIYLLLDKIKLKGLVPAGGDIGAAVEQALRSDDDELLIPVPGAALMQGSGQFVVWLPIKEIAEAIQGLIAARGQLFDDFYQLSGISDIMRGATEAEETLGAQQLKSQYGSVRVRDKIDELQRVARDVARIVAEIAADKFSQKTLLEMSMMEIPSKADIAKQIKGIEKAAEEELKALKVKAQEMAEKAQQPTAEGQPDPMMGHNGGPPMDPDAEFGKAQQQVLQKYAQQLAEVEKVVPIEDVVALLRDDRARGFAFEIATDSTIMTDEMAEKASRNEFLGVVATSVQSLMGLAAAGEAGAALAGGLIKFTTAPYRVGRELNGLIDDFVDAAPQMAQQMAGQGQPEGQAELIAAQNKLAEAEIMKAQAQTQKVSADAQGKMQELQLKGAEAQSKAQQDQQRLMLELQASQSALEETNARIQKIFAEIEAMGIKTQVDVAKVGIEQQREQRETVRTAADIQGQQQDRAMGAQHHAEESAFRAKGEERADRQQDFTERNTDRQQTFAERQAEMEKPDA